MEKADFFCLLTGPAMVRAASSDKWKAALISLQKYKIYSEYTWLYLETEKRLKLSKLSL